MTGPVLTHLGKNKLELGPARTAEPDGPWRAARDAHGVLWLALDCAAAGANTVSREVLEGLDRQLDAIERNLPRGVVIRSAKADGFAAGADISMFRELNDPAAVKTLLSQGHAVLDRLEALACQTICVVHGYALGGGFEIALACDRIIAVEGASFGFPEVNLGLHPGLGGTFRLPGRIDPVEAMTHMLTGKTVYLKKARALGIVDEVVEERHVEAAVHAAIEGPLQRNEPGLTDRVKSLSVARSYAARKMREAAADRAPKEHYPAPYALIDLWETHGDDRKVMQQGEIETFSQLVTSETSQNLVRVFFLQQALKDEARGRDGIAHVHVVGAGTMGAEIAAWCALKGKTVTLFDPDTRALGRAIRRAGTLCSEQHLTGIETRDALDRLMPDPGNLGVPKANLVIEAGPEDLEQKVEIYASLEPRMNSTAILATNTSSLPLTELSKRLSRPSRFAGLHFFNPVSKMQLVEVVTHDGTFGTVSGQLKAFCGAISRLPAHVRDYPGFLVNRTLTPYLLEAVELMDEGVDKEIIDRAAERFGMPVGPVELADQVGLDICIHVAESLRSGLDKPMPDIPGWLREKVNNGETGKKAGRGFYDWENDKPRKGAAVSDDDLGDLTDRLILPMLDACVECLRLDVVRDSEQLDGAMIFATGFAPFRGGPIHYAKSRGPDEIAARLNELADAHGLRFRPDPGWRDMS
ncbi:MAG: 3-hydroxyacyl-CoA dehydrogenase NAD-binding domain-containing protein [Neoaquamicrobium sediminum]|uniref:3-hydroxyacyl-CoA dehydrogenase NAD-binding domain-containing protein n=1 Tax=Neoaquamicrobium sediminum TaxID=1849104 RepID=UPI004035DA42